MNTALSTMTARPTHAWLRCITATWVPGPSTPVLDHIASKLLDTIQKHGHRLQPAPDDETDLILSTARYGEPVPWRDAPMFTARRRFHLHHTPTVFTLVHMTTSQFQEIMEYLATALAQEPPDPAYFDFPGLRDTAYRVLVEQGRRGGPILALVRLVQSQTKCIRILLAVGDDQPDRFYTLDLVGAHPKTDTDDPEACYDDLVLRIVTALSTHEIANHQVVEGLIPRQTWDGLITPDAMIQAGQRLGARGFFTEMVRIADLVQAPMVADAIASQYSEGCFATWDLTLGALIATVTGSARPVDKDKIGPDDLAVIVGIRDDGRGALVRNVEGHANHAPSTEAVEMMAIDRVLPTISLDILGSPQRGPVVRSKLHGHRSIASYDPQWVEYVPLDAPYFSYPVSCATEAQAWGIERAFARSEALRNPSDGRQTVFTILPGHGVVIAEKWVPGTVPFQVIWDQMDCRRMVVGNYIPQSDVVYEPDATGQMVLRNVDDI
jgi:hypothetical protein